MVAPPGRLPHTARILCSPGVCGTANSSGGAGVPAFLSRCQESHAEYTRSWLPSSLALKALSGLSSFHGSRASSPSLSTGGFADSSGHGGRLLVGLMETRLCSRGSQPLLHRSAPALSLPRCSCVHLSKCAVGRLNPSFGGQPPLDCQKCGFYSLFCWASFPSFSHLYSRGDTPFLALLSFMALGKLWNSCTLQT